MGEGCECCTAINTVAKGHRNGKDGVSRRAFHDGFAGCSVDGEYEKVEE